MFWVLHQISETLPTWIGTGGEQRSPVEKLLLVMVREHGSLLDLVLCVRDD